MKRTSEAASPAIRGKLHRSMRAIGVRLPSADPEGRRYPSPHAAASGRRSWDAATNELFTDIAAAEEGRPLAVHVPPLRLSVHR